MKFKPSNINFLSYFDEKIMPNRKLNSDWLNSKPIEIKQTDRRSYCNIIFIKFCVIPEFENSKIAKPAKFLAKWLSRVSNFIRSLTEKFSKQFWRIIMRIMTKSKCWDKITVFIYRPPDKFTEKLNLGHWKKAL